ncbi:hypothetical protein D9613_008045 [Agrocybe pediades]|uniref:DUF6534 domain-containing protein n=1 Tax=Agrocybe pediades TaxID=84607 RepID=A0A8H4VKJ4_9AGAR|nr:hypothetical protein D9613_008045 [Agrocybe pediades]
MPPPPGFDLDKTLGAVFIGNVVAAVLFGITSLQAFTFFRGNTGDSRRFKQLIAFLWILDLLHVMFMTHGVYSYLITNFCVFSALERPTWYANLNILPSTFLSGCVDGWFERVQTQVIITSEASSHEGYGYAHEEWLPQEVAYELTRASKMFTTLFVFAMGIAFAARGFIDMSYIRLTMESWILYTALGAGVAADGLITVALCMLLDHSRTGFKSTDSLVNTLMLYSINTGLLTSVCATACFVTFAIWPHQFVFMGFYFALSKLYVNSLLAVLNTRKALRRRNSGMTTIPQSPSSIEPFTMNFLTHTRSYTIDGEPTSPDVAMTRVSKVAWHDGQVG